MQDRIQFARRLDINGSRFEGSLAAVGLDMAEFAHDKAVVTVKSRRALDFRTNIGARVEFDYGDTGTKTFYGYITELSPAVSIVSGLFQQTITCFGVTSVMKSGSPRFWTDVTIPDVINSVCGEHRLGFNDESDPTRSRLRWPSLAQTEESDWEWISELAGLVGCVLLTQDGVVRLVAPEMAFDRYDTVQEFRVDAGTPDNRLFEFRPLNFSQALPESYEPVVGILSGTDVIVRQPQVRPTGVGTRFSAARALNSLEEAAIFQQSRPYSPRWTSEASATVNGSTSLVPGVPVSVRTTKRSSFPAPFDGVWYVAQVNHDITINGFDSTLLLRRYPQRVLSAVRVPNWWYNSRGAPRVRVGYDSKWISTWRK